jgi:tRNA dimethylallyltransferase
VKKLLVIITGPTAIGKTDLTVDLANRLNTEIVSCDSRQMYRELSIGTAIPSATQLSRVRHHFIHNISIHDYYNAFMYEEQCLEKLGELFRLHDIVFMTGGSGLYIDAVVHGIDDLPTIDPEVRRAYQQKWEQEGLESLRLELKSKDKDYYNQVDLKNPKRILKALEVITMTGKSYSSQLTHNKKDRSFDIAMVGLDMEREGLHQRINNRVGKMMEDGLLEEAREVYPHAHLNALNTVGYRELFEHLRGNIPIDQAVELIKRNTRRYARRQLSWFRRYRAMQWFSPLDRDEILRLVLAR